MVGADEHDDEHTGLVERVPPRVTGAVLDDRVAGAELPGGTVVQFERYAFCRLDAVESDEDFRITAELPGLEEDDFSFSMLHK